MKTTEWSHDGTTWYSTAAPGWVYQREIEILADNQTKQEIEQWLLTHVQDRIEYSNDGGHSFIPFRVKSPSEDAGRIVTLQKMNRHVRSLRLDNVNTIVGPGFGFRQTNAPKPARVMTKIKFVYRDTDRAWFSIRDSGNSTATITQKIPMTMGEVNTNELAAGYANTSDPINRGHVYCITQINSADVPGLDPEVVSYFEQMVVGSISDYALVESPRSYDAETEEALGGVFVCAVLSSSRSKYYVHSRHNPYKIGDTFFVKKAALKALIINLGNYGAYVSEEKVEVNTEGVVSVIMQLDTRLKEAIESDDPRELTVALSEAIKLRNDTVDALYKLRETINLARGKVHDMVANPSEHNS